MSSIKIGSTSFSDFKLGASQVQKVYAGTNVLWQYSPIFTTNYALSSNGGIASASSVYPDPYYDPMGAINGDRKGLNWGTGGGGWNSQDALPQWLQVNLQGIRSISEIDVFTVQDNYSSPSEPTLDMTFSLYGSKSYSVQYWNGSTWADISSVTNSNKVWNKFTFSPVITDSVRINVTASTDGYARITEAEAWGTIPSNQYCLLSNGATASASSTYLTYSSSYAIDSERIGKGVDVGAGAWTSNNSLPAWLEVDFSGSKTISEIDVYTVQDDYSSPTHPTLDTTFSLYGIVDFQIQQWNGSSWQTIQSVSGNDKVWRKFTFSPITTTKIRLYVTSTIDGYARVCEIEAW